METKKALLINQVLSLLETARRESRCSFLLSTPQEKGTSQEKTVVIYPI